MSLSSLFISVNTLIYPETPTGYGKTLSVTLNRYKEKTVDPDSEQITIIESDDLKGFESIAVAQIELNRLRKPKTRKKPYLSTFSLINKTFSKWSEWRDLNPRPLEPPFFLLDYSLRKIRKSYNYSELLQLLELYLFRILHIFRSHSAFIPLPWRERNGRRRDHP